MNHQKNFPAIIELLLGIILIASVMIGYIPEIEYIHELTCLSNFLSGVLLLVTGIRRLLGKNNWPGWFYNCSLVTVFLVFLVCMGSLSGMYHMNFEGAFLFLHVLNPLAIFVYYILLVTEKKQGSLRYVFLTPCFAIFYLFVDYLVGKQTGSFVYGFFEPAELDFISALLVGIVFYIMLLILGILFYFMNKVVHRLGTAPAGRWNR